MDARVTLRSPVDPLQQAIREISLTTAPDDPFYPVVGLHISEDGLAATAPPAWDGPAFRVRYDADGFADVETPDGPCVVPLGTEATLRWLDWFDAESVTATVRVSDGVAHDVVLESDGYSVEVGPLPTKAVAADPGVEPLDAFADSRFVYDGDPAPTRVETTGETLARLVAVVDIVDDESIPVVVEDGEFRLSVAGETMRGTGRLPATVEGPDCANRYGEGFAALSRVLSGPLELQVVPGGPMAVVQESDDATRRYALTQSM